MPVLFQTITTLLLLALGVKARFICEEPIAVAIKEAGSEATGLLIIVKLTFETSKKIFPTASTFILACVVGKFGKVITCEPSLGVLAIISVENVLPPLVDKSIRTFAQLTGNAVVFATLHVIV
ncbi:MAG: hypothetical protein Q8L68_03380, partial [Methylococcales bacterium]|nr:hypothetical protein [Methylococcales bacterium]